MNGDRPQTPPLPAGTEPLRNQVGGHAYGKGKTKLGMLEKDGVVLKPLQTPPRGERELHFYQQAFHPECNDPCMLSLRPLLPQFHGTWTTPEHPGVVYFGLENLTQKFQYPCVLDIKVGSVTYDHLAPPDKIERERVKCPWKEKTGFSIIGIKVYHPDLECWTSLDSHFLRDIKEEDILPKGLNIFFNKGCKNFNSGVIEVFLKKLCAIKCWFESQRQFVFYASSILFVYDAKVFMTSNHTGLSSSINSNHSLLTNGCSNFDAHADARMIDFTHVFPSDDFDHNYLSGIDGIIKYFKMVLE